MAEPVDYEQARAACDIVRTDQQTYIESLIVAGRAWVENYTGLLLVPTEVSISFDRFCPQLELTGWPIDPEAEITVEYIDGNGAVQTVAETRLRAAQRPARLWPAFGELWPSTDAISRAVTVSYAAGYADPDDVPQPLKNAIFVFVRQHIDNGMLTADGEKAMESLCRPYRLPVIG